MWLYHRRSKSQTDPSRSRYTVAGCGRFTGTVDHPAHACQETAKLHDERYFGTLYS